MRRLFFLALASLAWAGTEGVSAAAPPPVTRPQNPAAVQQVDLAYREVSWSIRNFRVAVIPRSAAFRKEPALVGGPAVRGFLVLLGGSTNRLGFLWDFNKSLLYLDLNQNLDLTDDSARPFTAAKARGQSSQVFTNLPVQLPGRNGPQRATVDLTLSHHSSAYLVLHSYWSGKLALGGRDWELGLIADLDAGVKRSPELWLFRSWDQREQPIEREQLRLVTLGADPHLFLGGQALQLKPAFRGRANAQVCQVSLVRQQPVLGALKLSGQFLSRVVLTGDVYTVILDTPRGEESIPAGRYGQSLVYLKNGQAEARRVSSSEVLRIEPGRITPLKLGGPLTNHVVARRRGKYLDLSHQVLGVDGATYQILKEDQSQPPSFTIACGKRTVHTGKFEFG